MLEATLSELVLSVRRLLSRELVVVLILLLHVATLVGHAAELLLTALGSAAVHLLEAALHLRILLLLLVVVTEARTAEITSVI